LLEADPEFTIVSEAANGLDVIPVLEVHQPDVVIIDLMLPGTDGIEVTRQVKQRWPDIRVVILTIHDSPIDVQQALSHGATRYVLKNATSADLAHAIRDVLDGRRYLSPALFNRSINVFLDSAQQPASDSYNSLTGRERQVLTLAAMGLNSATVAARLSISPRTVETHRAELMHKLALHTQTNLVCYAIRRGIVPLED
jgi:two-component system, NarL family, response regulator NreC